MGQKISLIIIDKQLQDQARMNLYMFMLKLLHPNDPRIKVFAIVPQPLSSKQC